METGVTFDAIIDDFQLTALIDAKWAPATKIVKVEQPGGQQQALWLFMAVYSYLELLWRNLRKASLADVFVLWASKVSAV